LRVAKEAGLQVVALEAPGDQRNEFVVEATAEGFCEGGVRGGVSGRADADMARTKQCMRERADLADVDAYARIEHEVMFTGLNVEDLRAARKIVGAVESVEVGDDTDPGQEAAFH